MRFLNSTVLSNRLNSTTTMRAATTPWTQALRNSLFFALAILAFGTHWHAAGQSVDVRVLDEKQWTTPEFWQSQDGNSIAASWDFANGEIRLRQSRDGSAALISPVMPNDFELEFQWMVTTGTNSGLKYRLRQFGDLWLGLEYQMIDEPIPLTQLNKGSTASIYELVAPRLDKPLRTANNWNDAKIVAHGTHVQHYLNGELVTEVNMEGPEWDACVARSKFYGHERFGLPTPGDRVMLTDHGGNAAFRKFKLKPLDAPTKKQASPAVAPQLANAMRNSWATQNSIVLWTRTTAAAEMIQNGPDFLAVTKEEQARIAQSKDVEEMLRSQLPKGSTLDQMLGACPGYQGDVRLTYFPRFKRHLTQSTAWSTTRPENDFSQQWALQNLEPNTEYVAIVEARSSSTKTLTCVQRGMFRTAPTDDAEADFSFCMTTCHDFPRRDDGMNGHKIYPSMTQLQPHFVIHAGDIEYYDHEKPWAWTVELMRFKWARIFSLPNNRLFYANHTSYFMKDDHDTLKDDCWAGQRFGNVSFEEGVKLFNEEQFPSRSPRYATVPWGKDVQLWLLEGRDYRSSNREPDGPSKTILGKEQKEWLFSTLRASKAKYKLVFSPTPIVGPDRDNKHDNHANDDFEFEGNELRTFFSSMPGVIVFCGDRHWQYASVDPNTQLWEFGCGPGSEKHQLGWKKGDVRPSHRFLRVEGGFLSGTLSHSSPGHSTLTIRHHQVDGTQASEFVFP
jgi:alkaline phosphatase D